MTTPIHREEFTFQNIGDFFQKHPMTLESLWDDIYRLGLPGIPGTLTRSQIDILKNPNSTVDEWDQVAGLRSTWQRYGKSEKGVGVGVKEQDVLIDELRVPHGWIAAAVSLWDDLDRTGKIYILSSWGVDRKTQRAGGVDRQLIKKAVESRNTDYWLQYTAVDRENDIDLIHRMVNRSNILTSGEDSTSSMYAAVDDVLSHLYKNSVVGYMSDLQMHVGIPVSSNTMKYRITGDMVANIAAPAFIQRVLDIHGGYENLDIQGALGSDFIENYKNVNGLTDEMLKREMVAGEGSLRIVPVVTEEGDGIVMGIVDYAKAKDTGFWDWGETYFSNEIVGYVSDPKGMYLRSTFEDFEVLALSDEIARGYFQIQREWESWGSLSAEREIGPRSIGQVPLSVQAKYDPEGHAYWDKFMEWNQEYKNVHTDPQQFWQSAWWYPARSLESFSTVHMDYIIKPMVEHFKTRETGPTNRPTNAQVQAYIDQESEKYGTLMKHIGDWFKNKMYIDPDFDYESYLGPPQPMMDKRYWL